MPSPLFLEIQQLLQQSQDLLELPPLTNYDLLIDSISKQIETKTNFFANRFDQLRTLYYKLLQTYQAQGIKLSLCFDFFELIVTLVEKRPILLQNKNDHLKTIFQYLYEMSQKIDFKCDQTWMKPKEGYTEDKDFTQDFTLTSKFRGFADRIASVYTYPKFNKFFVELLPSLWPTSKDDWKCQYVLLMIMSQLGEDIKDPQTMKIFVECAKTSINHPNAKVRMGVLHMIGQLSDDMRPNFQQCYGEALMPLIFSCTKDEVPKVQAYSMACLTNFIQELDEKQYHIIQPYIDEIVNVSEYFCLNGISSLKENTVSNLSSLLTIKTLTVEQVDRILGILNYIFTFQMHTKMEYNMLISISVQCLGFLLTSRPKQEVEKYLHQSVGVIESVKARIENFSLFASWDRICLTYNNFTDLQDIFPYILQRVFQTIQKNSKEVQTGIQSIINTIKSFKQNLKPYMNETFEFCRQSLLKLPSKDTKKIYLIYQVLSSLVEKLRSGAPDPDHDKISNETFSLLYLEVQTIINANEEGTNDNFILEQGLLALQKCTEFTPDLRINQMATKFAENLFYFTTKITKMIKTTLLQIKKLNQKVLVTSDQIARCELEQNAQSLKKRLKQLHDARLVIPDVFKSLFIIAPQDIGKFIMKSLYPHVSDFLQGNLSAEDITYGLIYLCNFLTSFDYQAIKEHAQIYDSKFCEYCTHKILQVRNCAVYGLGEFINRIPAQKTDVSLIIKWLTLLQNALSIKLTDQSKKRRFNFTRDNIISALGKLIYSKRAFYPDVLNDLVHRKWFQNLPLSFDKSQGNINHEMLLNILNQTPQKLLSQKEDVLSLLSIFARYFQKRLDKNDDLLLKNKLQTKIFVEKLRHWPIFIENEQFLWNSLPKQEIDVLTKLTSAP